jgi:Lon protease-like protein
MLNRFEDLPEILPIFPLSGAVVLPAARLPLHIFELRYRNMVVDALAGARLIGMLQPRASAAGDEVGVERTGCAGRITSFSESDDGRFLILLTGICRFDVVRELPLHNGYRRVEPDWGPYQADLADSAAPLDSASLLRSVRLYLQARSMHLDEESVDVASPRELVHGLVTRLPLESVEKQALIETDTLDRRADLLRTYCEFGSLKSTPETTRH